MKVLRWHVNRIHEEERVPKRKVQRVDVTITRGVRAIANPKELSHLKRENLELWQTDENKQVDGRTTVKALKRALTTKNVPRNADVARISDTSRRLVEDMVFVQFLEDESQLEGLWNKLRAADGLPDVSALAELDDVSWLDFTQQAREMSAHLYRQALGEEAESAEEAE